MLDRMHPVAIAPKSTLNEVNTINGEIRIFADWPHEAQLRVRCIAPNILPGANDAMR
jgi:hypothetical protein